MKYFDYQDRAVTELTDKTIKLLNEGGKRRKIVFKAPTGGGKTVMACRTLANIVDRLKSDGRNRYEDVAFIWFAPRKLHLQSYLKLKEAFADDRMLTPVMFDELEQSEGIRPGEILFVNWESVNKENNVMARNSESSASIFEIARITREKQGLPIIAIIDEEHTFWSKTADKTAAVLDRINPDVEIRISATPKTVHFDEQVRVPRQAVIEAGMIKKEVVLNTEIEVDIADDSILLEHLLKTALHKREQLEEAYRSAGSNIRPLLLVQLPNDAKETMTSEEMAIAEHVEKYLKVMCDITADNGKLAVWLANRKDNLTGLENPDNLAEVLLFKEAIALGWDCPRAAVLLIFRKLSSNEFTIQTVGRILRMPEHHHYTDGKLNVGYVYTDIAKDKIQILSADASYLKKNVYLATRREGLANVQLTSTYATRPNDTRNYLGPDFRGVLFAESEKFWNIEQAKAGLFNLAELAAIRREDVPPQQLPDTDDEQINENRRRVAHRLRLDVKNVNIPIPKDIHFQNEVQTLDVSDSVKFTRTAGEIDRVFIDFIAKYVAGFENKNHPADKLASYLLETLADFFGVFDTDAKKIVLHNDNRGEFEKLIREALAKYAKMREVKKKEAQGRIFTEFQWEVPDERVYDEDTHKVKAEVENHALLPFVELNAASTPEQQFVEFLERNSAYIDWWYKNGDSGRQHFAIPYELPDGSKRPFYVDFVIRLKNGKVYLFDTKSAGSEPLTAPYKHNGFLKYAAEQCEKGNEYHGGVIINTGENWEYSKFEIDNTLEHTDWAIFNPRIENA